MVPPGFVSGALPAGAPGQAGALMIDPVAVERIERLVAEYVDSITSMAVGGPEYGRAITAIGQLGERDFVATSAMSGRLLDRRFQAMRSLLAARAPLARQLADLRKVTSSLDPTSVGPTRPGGRRTGRPRPLLRAFRPVATTPRRVVGFTRRGAALPGAGQRSHSHGASVAGYGDGDVASVRVPGRSPGRGTERPHR